MNFYDERDDTIIIDDNDYDSSNETNNTVETTSIDGSIITDINMSSMDYSFIYENDDDDYYNRFYEDIYELEKSFVDTEKKDGQYVIGISATGFNNDGNIFACGITAKTFFKYPYKSILKYLFYYSIIVVYYPVIDIIKIHIDKDEAYISIRKTFWLRLIQIHWKKIMAERKEIQQKRRSMYSLFYREIKGIYPRDLNSLPTIHGMLSCYSKK